MALRRAAALTILPLLLPPLGAPSASAEPPSEEDWARLQEAVDILAREVVRLKSDRAIPAPAPDRDATGGSDSISSGLSIGGYGEFYFAAPTGIETAVRTADTYRFVTYVGYEFDDRILMKTELEYEHATTSGNADGRTGSVSVEFSHLEFRLTPRMSLRAGNLLIPSGFVNRTHEPPFYRGNFRPTIERTIIPSTWRELGAGLRGEPGMGVTYEAYLVNGLDASGYGPKGLRGGRQKGNRARWEDVAGVLAVDWAPLPALRAGASVFAGGADQGRSYGGASIDAFTTVAEGHVEMRRGSLRGRGVVAASSIGDADRIATEAGAAVPEAQPGWYVEAAFDLGPLLGLTVGRELRIWGATKTGT